MRERRRSKRRFWIRLCVLLVVLSAVLAGLLPSAGHARVSEETQASFQAQDCYASSAGTERVCCIDDNVDALLWRLRVIESAKEEIILATFDLRDDNSGRDILSALLNAAERGVQVRLLIDGISALTRLTGNADFEALISEENVEAKIYNPVRLRKPWAISFRMHDKYLIADHEVYLIGGRNTYDRFLGDYAENPNVDRDLLVWEEDPDSGDTSLWDLRDYFESVWQQSCAREPRILRSRSRREKAHTSLKEHYQELRETYPSAFTQTDYRAVTTETNRITLLTNPQEPKNKEPTLWYCLTQLMQGADSVVIQTPYVICSDAMYEDLSDVCAGAGSVSILLNAAEGGANSCGCVDYLNHREDVSDTGAVLYEYLGDHSSHVKMILVDDRLCLLGSYNLDMRSTYLDTEIMLAVDCPQLNGELRAAVEEDKECSRQVLPDGTQQDGARYQATEMTAGKKAGYAVLRTISRVFRFLY